MLLTVRREWHKFWYLTYNFLLVSRLDGEKYLYKSNYHGKKLVQLL
ncbi:hypothetical protein [Bacillus suaedaesalsae]|uniref:Uncharacterized protein n=1 Tax=Bacillus suaedaesalsae TaxID=2810349 RepID=A0ABS2DLY8_9BACI|nr:hypothetical protein [Bacillus suaedaesalsae]MBM6619080.1 hypothetical protein [Bacillus suaedaesalsae]